MAMAMRAVIVTMLAHPMLVGVRFVIIAMILVRMCVVLMRMIVMFCAHCDSTVSQRATSNNNKMDMMI